MLVLPLLLALSHLVNCNDLVMDCPEHDRCDQNHKDRSCECDSACRKFGDCCVDVPRSKRAATLPGTVRCLHVGERQVPGVYVVDNCSSGWSGSPLVRQKCLAGPDFSDPLTAAPEFSAAQAVTYKNLFCAECNGADMHNLQTFVLKLACEGFGDLSQEQIIADLQYDQRRRTWGVSRLTPEGAEVFVDCRITFDVPDYLNDSVRFCRPDLVSECTPDWDRPAVRERCGEYLAIVYDRRTSQAYRNPHCALCNQKSAGMLTCRKTDVPHVDRRATQKQGFSFADLIDLTKFDGNQVNMTKSATTECPSDHKYDPFAKRCRKLVCALPGHVIKDDKCIQQQR